MAKKETSKLIPGDIVRFANVNRIVLNEMVVDAEKDLRLYHIFHPERGVYSAHREELIYVGHSDKWNDMIKDFNSFSMTKGA